MPDSIGCEDGVDDVEALMNVPSLPSVFDASRWRGFGTAFKTNLISGLKSQPE